MLQTAASSVTQLAAIDTILYTVSKTSICEWTNILDLLNYLNKFRFRKNLKKQNKYGPKLRAKTKNSTKKRYILLKSNLKSNWFPIQLISNPNDFYMKFENLFNKFPWNNFQGKYRMLQKSSKLPEVVGHCFQYPTSGYRK